MTRHRAEEAAAVELTGEAQVVRPSLPALGVGAARMVTQSIVFWLVSKGVVAWLGLDESVVREIIAAVITIAFTLIYYIGLRILEVVKSSKWGILLGYPVAPVYPKAAAPALIEAATVVDEAIQEKTEVAQSDEK